MGVILEIAAGPMAGKKVAVATGQTVTFGRAAGRAQFALPHDTFMSGVHFAVECAPGGCRVQDRKSSNGTFLNGARIQDAMLANGDEIKSGQTVFTVKMVADAKLASMSLPQEASLTSTAMRRRRAAQPAPPEDASEVPQSQDRKPAHSSALEQLPGVAQPVEPAAVSPAAGAGEERKLASRDQAPQPAARSGPGWLAEPPPVMRSADLGEQASEPPARGSEPAPEVAAQELSRAPGLPSPGLPPKLDAPAEGLSARPEVPAENAVPQAEDPPHLRSIPSPPRGAGNQPSAGMKPPRGSEPPAGVASYIAEKFVGRPGSRGVGSPRGFAFSVMGWSFPAAPAEWQVQEGFGLQQSGHEEFPSSVAASEELLGGITLQQFVESQISMLRGYLRDPKIEPTMPPRIGGADESMAVDVRHSTKDGRELVYRRIYARSGTSVGVLTVTTLAADLPQVLQSLQPLLDGAAFRATVNN